MGKIFNRAGMTVTGTPGTGTVTLNAAITSPKKYLDFATAGAANSDVVSYLIEDGVEFEHGIGTYTTAGTTLSRDTVRKSSNAGAKISATSAALVYIDAGAEDIGKAVQVVNTITGAVATGTTTIPYDDTIPQNTEGDQYMSLAITPQSAANLLKIEVVINLAVSAIGAGQVIVAALFQDSTANSLAACSIKPSAADVGFQLVFTHYMTAGTTSATTFKVRAGNSAAATATFNGAAAGRKFGGVMASSITITEVRA